MNQKELSELKRRFRPDKSAIHRIYGCFVNGNQEIVSLPGRVHGPHARGGVRPVLRIFEESPVRYPWASSSLTSSFPPSRWRTARSTSSLSALRDSQLKDAQARETFYRKIIDALELDGNYLILLAHDAYDVPRRGRTTGFRRTRTRCSPIWSAASVR